MVIDRKTVDRTCINGPQWFHREFAEPAAEAEDAAMAAGGEKARGAVHRARLCAQRRKKPDPREIDDVQDDTMREFLRVLIPTYDEAQARTAQEYAARENRARERRC